MAERLTKKDKPILKNQMEDNMSVNKNTAIKRLWQYENVMEKYGIESFELLEHIIKKGIVINSTIEDFAKEEYDKMKQDRNTWKRACELACEYMCKFVIPCPDIHRKECKSFCDLNKADCYQDYFYQQAKKEKDGDNNDTNN